MIIEMSKHPWKCSKVSNELESRYWCDQLYSSALFFSNIYDFGSEFKIMLKMKLLPIDCFNDEVPGCGEASQSNDEAAANQIVSRLYCTVKI